MSADDSAPPTRSGFFTEIQLAFSFLTILPVIDQRPASEETVAASFAWFPIVGFLIGLALAGEDWILAHFFAQVIRSVLIIHLAHHRHRRGSSRRTGRHGRRARRWTRARARARHPARQPRRHLRRERDLLRPDAENPRALDAGRSSPLRRADRRADARALGDDPGRARTAVSARLRLRIDAAQRQNLRCTNYRRRNFHNRRNADARSDGAGCAGAPRSRSQSCSRCDRFIGAGWAG